MESEEKWMGNHGGGGGPVCHQCGWEYPNPHPSAKHRRAHKKHCGGPAADVSMTVEGSAGGIAKKTSDEELFDEDLRKESGEVVTSQEENPKGDEEKENDCSGEDGRKLDNAATSKFGTAGNTLEAYALHGSMVESSEEESAAYQMNGDVQPENHLISSKFVIGATGDIEISSSLSLSLDASKNGALHGVTENLANNDITNGTSTENSIQIKVENMSEAPILLHDSASNSTMMGSDICKMDDKEINFSLGSANAVTTMMKNHLFEASANNLELDTQIQDATGEQSNAAGLMFQDEQFSKGGSLSGVNCAHSSCCDASDNCSYTSSQSSRNEYGNGECADSLVKSNGTENLHTLVVGSSTPFSEVSEVNPGSCIGCGFTAPNLTMICSNSEAGNKPENHLGPEISRVLPLDLAVVETDKNANSILLTLQEKKNDSVHIEKVNIIETAKSKEDQVAKCLHINGDKSDVVYQFEHEDELYVTKFEDPGSLGSDWLENNGQSTIEGPSTSKAVVSDSQFTSSCESRSNLLEQPKVECLSEGQDINLLHEVASTDHIIYSSSCLPVSSVVQSNGRAKISDNGQLVGHEVKHGNSNVVVGDGKEENHTGVSSYMCIDNNYCLDYYVSESQPLSGDGSDTENNEMQNTEYLAFLDDVLSGQYVKTSSDQLDNMFEHQLDQLDDKETLMMVLTANAVGDDKAHYPDRKVEIHFQENKMQNDLPETNSDGQELNKVGTEKVENITESQVELQNGAEVRIADPADDCSSNFVTEINSQISAAEKQSTTAKLLIEETGSNESSEVVLFPVAIHNLPSDQCGPLKVNGQFIENPVIPKEPKANDISGVVVNFCCQCQLSQQKDAHIVSKQQLFDNAALDNSVYTEVCTNEGPSTYMSEGGMQSSGHSAHEVPILDAKSLPLTDAQTSPLELGTSNVATTEGAVSNINVDDDLFFEVPSFVTLVEPGRRSLSNEIRSLHNSRHEPEGKNKKDIADALNNSSGKQHVMLKTLLANGSFDSKRNIVKGQNHTTSLTNKKKAATSRMTSDKSNASSDTTADHREWNSPARLPVNKHGKKKAKAWVPFFCCQHLK